MLFPSFSMYLCIPLKTPTTKLFHTMDFLKCSHHFYDHVTTGMSSRHPFLFASLSFCLPPLVSSSMPVLSNLFQGEILFIPKVSHTLYQSPKPVSPARPFLHSHTPNYLVSISDKLLWQIMQLLAQTKTFWAIFLTYSESFSHPDLSIIVSSSYI